ncbi:MAG: hypothetical protein RLZZ574_672 [Cyanobacteriota bacterium]|jgi:hypothetical protein
MSFSLCPLSWGFSALFISMTIIGCGSSAKVHQEAQTRQAQSHDYQTAVSLAMSAADRCYEQRKLDECDRLVQMENTLSTWCSQNDQGACEVYESVIKYDLTVKSSQMQNELLDQME